jgi:hypothetical protein
MRTNDCSNPPQAGLLGIAFDATDGDKRLTRGKNFILAGGCEETHGRMQETAIKVNEQLDERGKQLGEVSASELRDIFCDVTS